jgi:hypothetical protein
VSDLPPKAKSLRAALLALIGGALSTGMVSNSALADSANARSREDEDEANAYTRTLLIPSTQLGDVEFAKHGSHASHTSHRSHASHSSSNHGSGYVDPGGGNVAPPQPPPPPPQPGFVKIVAFPGGKIAVDGKDAGRDETQPMSLTPGSHVVEVSNQFAGTGSTTIEVGAGQKGEIDVEW